ncbi:pyruvate dehydrogenase E2 component (dihydrolipoamide acetyltransferase) [Persephonella hydrogeniphila]|uniref:Dihydrolipoamide acetyltransferase component of pyruvate dehydrogenase complex n=1 Tax=Persephonella hydrogeniphila TaxID=198703 RepID=A0A285N280_9AQUI|nr:dihydrolipoamide acetyltransferase family protein [Persephonella hydrogeniphila]SNZ03438.1 pyruvate dehydrogenase E2 component (dihydrolipoamide acetyltransferase) [Persephonella hydrogeniphila]
MEYKVVMPQLTDTMEEGKIVRWLKKEGDYVKKDEPLVEIESDKAVMEVPSMREGVLIKILAEEGEELPVGSPIAVIETEVEKAKGKIGKPVEVEKTTKQEAKKEEKKEKKIEIAEVKVENVEEIKLPEGTASPAARKLAAQLGLDLKELQEKGELPSPAHENDIKSYFYKKFFTKQALQILDEFGLEPETVYKEINKKKISKDDLLNYIKQKNIPKVGKPSDIQSILIKNLSKSAQIPVYHITHRFDVSQILKDERFTLTTYLIKIVGDVMQNHPRVRTIYKNGEYYTYPASNISVAIAVDEELFNPTIKNVEDKSLSEIYAELKELKEKSSNKRLTVEDIQGATFSISNLGMFGVIQFDAIIPPFHSGIVGIGTAIKGVITATFTFDHRVINGAQAAQFVVDIEKRINDKKYLKSLK